jgi:type II secretory pathway pseudopilin PulG
MRSLLAVLALFLVPFASYAQDAAAMATQQMEMTEQQNLIVQQQVQQQQDLTQQQIQQQQQNLVNQANDAGYSLYVRKPSIAVGPGLTPGTVTVRLRAKSRGAEVFYTTDGWTPTAGSRLYTGPITLDKTTCVQAVAFHGGLGTSLVAQKLVTLAATTAAKPGGPVEFAELRVGASLPVEFSAPVQQNDLQVGDTLPVVLAQDLRVGGKLVAPKGSAVLATVTHNDKRGFAGQPGELSFAVHSLTLANGHVLPLEGGRTMQGAGHIGKAAAISVIPVAGFAGLLVHGGGAVISKGAAFDAQVAPAAVPEPVVSLR